MSTISRYDFEDRVLGSLRRRGGDATVGDVSSDTGLPFNDVETAMRHLLTVYKSHLDVDDDGNLRYRFDPSFLRRGEDKGRTWYNMKQAVWRGFKFLFKIWIMVMLVGYTIVFVVILIALAVGAIAGTKGEGDSGGIALLPLRLLGRLLEWMFWINLFDGGSRRRQSSRLFKRQKKKVEKPFYQKVFDFVFGPEKKVDALAAQQSFTDFVVANDGRLTAGDWAAMTGQSLEEAETALTASIIRFNGDVDVSENGTLIYRFDELLVTAKQTQKHQKAQRPIWSRTAKSPKLTGNPGSTNGWITGFNLFILVMSTFAVSLTGQIEIAAVIGLGWVPMLYSILFFLVPITRWIFSSGKSRAVAKENGRRVEMKKIFESLLDGEADPVVLDPAYAKELAVDYRGEPRVADNGQTYFFFDALTQEITDGRESRQAGTNRVVFGDTIFSSDEEKVSLDDHEMAEFDRRLAQELQGQHVSFDYEIPQVVQK